LCYVAAHTPFQLITQQGARSVANTDETQGQSSKTDSKDFIEHLRTVHFTLVTVCLALVVILQFPSPVSIREAIRQLDTIKEAAHILNSTWTEEKLGQELANNSRSSLCNRPVMKNFVMVAHGKRLRVDFDYGNWILRTSEPMRLEEKGGEPYRYTSMNSPERLDEFKRIWDNSYSILCPIRIADEGVMFLYGGTEVIESIHSEPITSPFDDNETATLADNSKIDEPTNFKITPNFESKELFYRVDYPTNKDGSQFRDGSPILFNIPVLESAVFPNHYRDILIKEMAQYRWLHSDFKDAFYELNQATEGFQDLDFDHLKQILEQNEKNSKEAFQAFGITFPIETTTRWGTLIIIVIQFYFLLHFMEHRKKESLTNPDIAWIGVYNSFGAQVLFGATAWCLPFGVVIFVCVKAGLLPQIPVWNTMLCTIALTLSFLFSALSVREYFRKPAKV